jgi:hypothetical protein
MIYKKNRYDILLGNSGRFINNVKRIAICGGPGKGKTTYMFRDMLDKPFESLSCFISKNQAIAQRFQNNIPVLKGKFVSCDRFYELIGLSIEYLYWDDAEQTPKKERNSIIQSFFPFVKNQIMIASTESDFLFNGKNFLYDDTWQSVNLGYL